MLKMSAQMGKGAGSDQEKEQKRNQKYLPTQREGMKKKHVGRLRRFPPSNRQTRANEIDASGIKGLDDET